MLIVKRKIHKKLLHRHIFFGDIANNPKTYAASVMLHRHYSSIAEPDRAKEDWRYLFIAKRTFLRHHRNENGNWTCHYCRAEKFQMPVRGRNWQKYNKIITIDHKDPACRCADVTDSSNFLPACAQCNRDKGDKSYEDYTSKHFTKDKFRLGREHDLKTIFNYEKP